MLLTAPTLVNNYLVLYCSILTLKALDGFVVSDEEIIGNLRLPQKYRAMGSSMKLPAQALAEPVSICSE